MEWQNKVISPILTTHYVLIWSLKRLLHIACALVNVQILEDVCVLLQL